MWIYAAPFISLAILSFMRPAASKTLAVLIAVFLIVWVGLRHDVSADWGNYTRYLEKARGVDLFTGIQLLDPGYALLNWLGANGAGGIYFVNIVCAVLAVVPLVMFCQKQKNPWLALMVAMPYLVTVVFMNYTRQGVAVGFGMLAMLAVQNRKIWHFLGFVTLAALFHNAAVCFFVVTPALFAGAWNRSSLLKLLGAGAYALALTSALLWSDIGPLLSGYIIYTGETVVALPVALAGNLPATEPHLLYSAGAVVRIAQSVVAAVCLLVILRRTKVELPTAWLWSIMSAVVIALFVMAFFRSTLADRLAVFFVPIQLYAFANLPGTFRPPLSYVLQTAIVLCSGAAFWVWLNYGSDTDNWLPYRSLLWL